MAKDEHAPLAGQGTKRLSATDIQPGEGWEWMGDHIRPRVAVPADWHWLVGLSLSREIGYQRRSCSEDEWTWELRPIIDKQWGR
jgi:hypothetical protein